MSTKYTERGAASSVTITDLNSLPDDDIAIADSAIDNSTEANRSLYADFTINLAAQGSARSSDATVSLILLPSVNSVFPDASGSTSSGTVSLASNYIAKIDGVDATFDLDATTTARVINASGVKLDNAPFKPAILNQTGQAFGASGNTVYITGFYTLDDV